MLEGVFAPDYKSSLPHANGCVRVIDSRAAEGKKYIRSVYVTLYPPCPCQRSRAFTSANGVNKGRRPGGRDAAVG